MRLRDSNEFIADIKVTRWLDRQSESFYLLRKDYIHRTAIHKQNDPLFFHWETRCYSVKEKRKRVNYDTGILSVKLCQTHDFITIASRRSIDLTRNVNIWCG